MTLACEDANSKLVEVVTVADVDAEKSVHDSLVQIWKLKFGHKVKFLLSTISNLKFRQNFEVEVWSLSCC